MLGMARPLLLEIYWAILSNKFNWKVLKIYTDLMMLSRSEKELVGGQGISSKGKLVMTQNRQPKKKSLFIFPPYKKKKKKKNR